MYRVFLIVKLTLHVEALITPLSHLLFNLVFRILSITFSRQVELKSRAKKSRVCQDFQEFTWGNFYNNFNLVNTFNDLLTYIISRRVPTKIIRCHITDKAWFDDNCINAFNNKQNACHLWKHTRCQL